ncbi:putative 4-hydroxybenzoate polyprenyltransferase [soil metagenome]|nr:4-hydroxybenzoate octaprenyltransferase [Trueperaceae bacterium]
MAVTPAGGRLAGYLRLVRFQHTLFALPFAYVGMLLAAGALPGWSTFLWITLAMVGARSASMALNRVIDARIDARNPRTAGREIPTGAVKAREALVLAAAGFLALALAGWALNPLTVALLPVAVAFLTLYPYAKRFTWTCHAWLGLTVGAAAAGGWIAVTGAFAPATWALWAAVALWIAGFDVIYALLDEDFDRRVGLHSVPVRFGTQGARVIAIGAHVASWVCFALAAILAGFGPIAWLGLIVVAGVFAYAHALVARRGADDALRAFDANLWVGAVMLAAVAADVLLR